MRKQTRSKDVPSVRAQNGAAWTQAWLDKSKGQMSPSFTWPQVDGKTVREWILPELRKMNQDHCSFCDSFPIDTSSKEPIEHFRPKHRNAFPHLAYEWTNLYYSCELCQSSKHSQWDEDLLAPDDGSYHFLRYFICDFVTGEILPNPLADENEQRRATTTLRIYGINLTARCERRIQGFEDRQQYPAREIDRVPFRDFLEFCSTP
jgi:uncharacterized protein (TIGR02646 family)